MMLKEEVKRNSTLISTPENQRKVDVVNTLVKPVQHVQFNNVERF